MSLLRSARGAHRRLDWRAWALAGLVAWLAPVAAGVVLGGLAGLAGRLLAPDAAPGLELVLYISATALVISPAFAWIGLLILLPLLHALAAVGWLGWLPALAAGALAGELAATLLGGLGSLVGPMYGLVSATILRAVLVRLRPHAL